MFEWKDECGVFAAWGDPEASRMAYLGLYAQQHRGEESCGIVSLDQGKQNLKKGMGLVADVFTPEVLKDLPGSSAIGHVRYSTTGDSLISNAQPLTATLQTGVVAIAHNGNLLNTEELKKELIDSGSIFRSSSDSECLLHLMARITSNSVNQRLKKALKKVKGAYSLVLLSHNQLIVARDPDGFRPLSLGKRKTIDGREAYVVASETCAFDLIDAEYIREIKPGEVLTIDDNGLQSEVIQKKDITSHCVFEHVYFARPDSKVNNHLVYNSRKKFGEILAQENNVSADLVIPVPDSGTAAAIGFSQKSGIPFDLGIIRNHYVGRTFIQPAQSIRSFGVKIKLNPQRELIAGKRIVVVDDSLVRGTTSKKIISLLRNAGAKKIHFYVASPPTVGPCYYGIDTQKRTELIAANKSQREICNFIDADSLAYLTTEGMMEALNEKRATPKSCGYCAACFDKDYPHLRG